MKTIPLTQGYDALIDDSDFALVSRFKWHAVIDRRPDGSVRTVYAARSFRLPNGESSKLRLHRVLLGISDDSVEVDHRNHDGLDNRRRNLRVCSTSQNQANSRAHRENRSGCKGVYFSQRDQHWHVSIQVKRKRHFVGCFKNKELAVAAYQAAAVAHFGEFAENHVAA